MLDRGQEAPLRDRFNSWLLELGEEPEEVKPRRKGKRRGRRRPLRLATLDQPTHRALPLKAVTSEKRFPLQPLPRGEAMAMSERLFKQVAEAASLPDFEPGSALWPPGTAQVPATLSIAFAGTLTWVDNITAKSWRWNDGCWQGLSKEAKAAVAKGLLSSVDGDDPQRRRRRPKRPDAPLVVVKIAPGCNSLLARAVAMTVDKDNPGSGTVGTAETVAALLHLIFTTPPVGHGAKGAAIVVQKYVRPKGPTPWMVRIVVPKQNPRALAAATFEKMPYAWIVSDEHDKHVTKKSRTHRHCTIVKSPPNATAWTKPKVLASHVLAALNRSFAGRAVIADLACDFIQDDDEVWWLLQVKGYRLEDGALPFDLIDQPRFPPAKPKRRNNRDDSSDSEDEDTGGRRRSHHHHHHHHERKKPQRCQGQYCDVLVPVDQRHMYGQTLGQGPRYTLPRKVLLQYPRIIPPDVHVERATVDGRLAVVLNYTAMSRQDRMQLYDHISVCANCHYAYAGCFRAIANARLPGGPTSIVRRQPVDDETCLIAAAPVPAVAITTNKTPEESPRPESTLLVVPSEVDPSASAAGALRAAIDDIDAIHSRASVEMEHAMNSHLTASLFLSSIDRCIEEAEQSGVHRFASIASDLATPLFVDKDHLSGGLSPLHTASP